MVGCDAIILNQTYLVEILHDTIYFWWLYKIRFFCELFFSDY